MKSPKDFGRIGLGDNQKRGGDGDVQFQKLLAHAQGGDEIAKSNLCSYVWKVAHNRALNVTLPSVYEQDDFAQDVVVQFLKQLLLIQDLEKWLIRICYGVRARAFRNYHQKFLSLSEETSYGEAEQAIESKQLTSLGLSAALQNLKPLHRKVIHLRYQDDLPFAEIAKIMEMSEGAVKTIFWRIKAKLKRQLVLTSGEGDTHGPDSRRTQGIVARAPFGRDDSA